LKHSWLILLVIAVSCNTIDVFERSRIFPSHNWPEKERPSFSFDISDTTSPYNIFLVIRHKDAYRYNNLWVNITMKGPGDSISVRREFILANNTKGWLGSGMDDIFEHRILFSDKPAPLRQGRYTFTLQQAMREDPLEHILNVGIRVEKVK